MDSPPISIILPTYNRAHTLERAIDSVFQQTYKNWELLVVDDGSTDNTREILEPYLQGSKVKYFRQDRRGVSAARNAGVMASMGSWLAFLDSDDEWMSHKLELQVKQILTEPEVKIIHTEEIWVRNAVRVNPAKKHRKKGGWIYPDALKLCCMSPSSIMINKEFFQQFRGFREDFPVCEDYHLWLHMTSQVPVFFIPEPLVIKYGGHEDQLSRSLKAMDYYRVRAMSEILENRQLPEEWRQLTLQELKHKSNILLKGYRKHNNLHHYDEVLMIQQKWCS